MDDDLCYLCPCVVFVFRYVWILFKCGSIRFMIYSLFQSFMFRYAHSGHYKDSTLVFMADFLLVNIYTLRNGLRNKELRVGVSGMAADLAHFYA